MGGLKGSIVIYGVLLRVFAAHIDWGFFCVRCSELEEVGGREHPLSQKALFFSFSLRNYTSGPGLDFGQKKNGSGGEGGEFNGIKRIANEHVAF